MQTTDPRRAPRPDSGERTPKPDAAAQRPVNRRAPQRRSPNQSMLVFAAVLVVACIGTNRVSYVYSEAPLKTHNADVNRTASQAITADFGDETVLAVVVPAGDYTREAALLDALSALPEVKSAVGIAGTEAAGGYRLADAVDYRTFAQLSGVDSTSAQALFAL